MQPYARRWIYVALAYFCTAVTIGCWMGATQRFNFAPLHAHLNLLGWVTMTLTGMIYHHFPAAGSNKLAQVHFWGYNLLLPVQMTLLAMLLAGNTAIDPALGAVSMGMFAMIVLFAINVWRNGAKDVSASPAAAAASARSA